MSERPLETFRRAAERITPLPDFELIEAAGRRRRHRRHTVVGAAAACLLAAIGLLVVNEGARQDDVGPAGDHGGAATPYPGPEMVTLVKGTYDLTPYADVTLPAARVTVPDGWNAAQYGPDQFEGIGPAGADNERALRDSTWYAGLVVTEVNSLSRSNCDTIFLLSADAQEVLSALMELPRLEVTSGPDTASRFGHPAVHLSMRETRRQPVCRHGAMFGAAEGRIGKLGLGGTYDLWLVDVDGDPLLVVAGWTRNAPRGAVKKLLATADTIELHPRLLPWRE